MLVSCISSDNYENAHYYDALFTGNNDLMAFASQFDPVLLSHPAWDEMLWNGDVTEGWQLDAPTRWPVELTKESDSVEDAVKLFKSIKRKFFFENAFAKELVALQPQYYSECIDTLSEIGEALCKSLGFNPTSNSTKPLYVANSLFRMCAGVRCKVDDIHEWVVSERRKATPSGQLS